MTSPSGFQAWNGPTGMLVLNLKKPWGSMGMISPIATIDGYPARVTWGRNEFPAPAGPRRVQLSCTYMWEFGRASDIVPVEPNSRVEVFYAPPMLTFLRGRIGPVEQKRPGVVPLVVLLALIALMVVLVIIGAVLDS